MTVVPQSSAGVRAAGGASTGTLYDVVELILDRGLVIDVFVRVSLLGIEILKIDVRIVVASVDTYLRFAEACNRLDLESGRNAPAKLTDMISDSTGKAVEGVARKKSKGAIASAVESITDTLRERDDDRATEAAPHHRRPARPRTGHRTE
ncbi:gas vesicle protein GvpJ [Kitasatospora sp. DSM 101779]|uniref:gas vesicle protein GvpJ n=1 Tax=Kitasatospora sp. DSM 101779 TaxID=2853165 RepID=UPI0021D88EEA|nr:gas vesicle protein GvpJ [Kitasatospora sp. DSM 101779]MCU7820272.1 gas vesicle structural protein GvpA [Kitasatospora sp. DSM 101779]